jgi:cytochrome c oxidase subunit II
MNNNVNFGIKNYLPFLSEHHGFEFIWTIIPAGILWTIGIPSLKFLYLIDQILEAEITIKAIGNQWYWSYEYENNADKMFDSFLIQQDDLNKGDLRQLTVDNYLILPINTNIRMLITSNDVIHSFAIPSLGVKCDALPGRLNSFAFNINRKGIYFGQCSELCGVLHGFMPIGIKAVNINSYLNFLAEV